MQRAVTIATMACFAAFCLAQPPASAQTPAGPPAGKTPYEQEKSYVNANVITIAAGAPTSTYAKIAEDIQVSLEDPKAKDLRIMPTMSRGGGQNLVDLLFLKGIDAAIVEQDHLVWLKSQNPVLYRDIDQRVRLIAKLYDSEFHVLTTKNVRFPEHLRGKKVNFFKELSSSAICAETVFSLLGVPIEATYYDDATALEKLRSGEIAAAVRLGGAPIKFFADIKDVSDLHFLSFAEGALPPGTFNKLVGVYVPTLLTSSQYPNLIAEGDSVQTVANATMLAVYNWPEGSERYQRLARFVDTFFTNFDRFREPARHPKWKEVNLAAEADGWKRFQPAKLWLENVRAREDAADAETTKAFETFIKAQEKNAGVPYTAEKKAALKAAFMAWWKEKQQAVR